MRRLVRPVDTRENVVSEERYEMGLEIRRKVLGDDYVDNALKNVDDFNQDFQRLVTEYCWGASWGRESLSHRQRSLNVLCLLAALNRPHEFEVHFRGALRNGCSIDRAAGDAHPDRDLRRHSSSRGRSFSHRAEGSRRGRRRADALIAPWPRRMLPIVRCDGKEYSRNHGKCQTAFRRKPTKTDEPLPLRWLKIAECQASKREDWDLLRLGDFRKETREAREAPS